MRASPVQGATRKGAPRVFEAICEHIRAQLVSSQLRPGDRLPAERALAESLGISRTAVREALKSLENAGIVELKKGVSGGAFVKQGDPAIVTRSMSDMMSLGSISLRSLTESRVQLQSSVIRLACQRAGDADFLALEECLDQTARLDDATDMVVRRTQIQRFYKLLAQATQNEVMVMLVDSVTEITLNTLSRFAVAPRTGTLETHRQILRSLRKRDAETAISLSTIHLQALHDHLLSAAEQVATRSSGAPRRKRKAAEV